jgi:TonB-dependent SusC/RagA subfamily outer membrane receptor
MKKGLLLIVLIVIVFKVDAQEYRVSGRVTAFGEIGVENFPVVTKKSKAETVTDSLGYFTVKCESKDQIIFKGKPFMTKKIKVNNNDSVIINLIYVEGKNSQDLVVEQGFMDPDQIAYAVTELSANNSRFYQYTNIYDLLRSEFHDIEITDSKQIFVRSQASSLTLNTSALLILNGLEVNDISSVMPVDVKSVQLLKGSEAAFYGSRGSNGVIVINLK